MARIGLFPDWSADCFVLLEQVRIARAAANLFAPGDVVLAVDVAPLLANPTMADLVSLGPQRMKVLAQRLGAAFEGGLAAPRATIMEPRTRHSCLVRYGRIPPDASSDLSGNAPAFVPRDGAVDFNDAPLWICADWVNPRALYPVCTTVTTYHPLADALLPTFDAVTAFNKRIGLLEVETVLCAGSSAGFARARFGLPASKVRDWALNFAEAMPVYGPLLILTDTPEETARALDVLSREHRRRPQASPEAIIAETLGPATHDHALLLTAFERGEPGASVVAENGFAAAASLIKRCASILVFGSVRPRAFAIARWIDRGKRVVMRMETNAVDLSPWPRAAAIADDDHALLRAARGILERAA